MKFADTVKLKGLKPHPCWNCRYRAGKSSKRLKNANSKITKASTTEERSPHFPKTCGTHTEQPDLHLHGNGATNH